MSLKKVKKYCEYINTKINVALNEKKYTYNNYQIRYIFEKNTSNRDLLIIFSSCTRMGIKARYNYMRTLKRYKVNKLFILDDFGYDKRGLFYIGEKNNYEIYQGVQSLINKFELETESKNTIYIGSSKGGYAALLFGLRNDSKIITGAPQYFLGDYLNTTTGKERLENIIGDINKEKIDFLNSIIKDRLNKCKNVKVFLHYSVKDLTYDKHIKYLINDIRKNDIYLEEDRKDYEKHGDVSIYFPDYIISTLNKIL